MRHVCLVLVAVVAGLGARASAAPFESAKVPDRAQAIGHLDVDALRKTQLFATAGGQAMIDAALDDALDGAPAKLRPVARSLSRSLRGVSFWRDTEHGAVYVDTRDSKGLGQLIAGLPVTPAPAIDGFPSYTLHTGSDREGYCAAFGDTLVLADSAESLERSIRVLSGKAVSLAGRVPAAARNGVFVFVALSDTALGAIQKSAQSKVLQLGLRSLVVDVDESGGMVTASARAEMRTADALQKAKSIVEGLRAMASLAADDAAAHTLLDAVTVSARGLTLEVNGALSPAELIKLVHAAGDAHGHHHDHK